MEKLQVRPEREYQLAGNFAQGRNSGRKPNKGVVGKQISKAYKWREKGRLRRVQMVRRQHVCRRPLRWQDARLGHVHLAK